jgi:hypothetical protein
LTLVLLSPGLILASSQGPKSHNGKAAPVAARIETTLRTAGGQIRQFAFDGNANTYFASEQNPGKADHFTLVFDKPVRVKSVTVTTGKPITGKEDKDTVKDRLDQGSLQVSVNGKDFKAAAKFSAGVAHARPEQSIRAIRVQPAATLDHPLAIRELAIVSDPPVRRFKYPVEFIVGVVDAPDMKRWAEKVAGICERAYPMINDELRSEGFKPPRLVHLTLKKGYDGVAMASGDRITGSVKYFKAHPDDVGAMVHETVHVVQHYRAGNTPGWLVEGIADYIRFFKFEPGKLGRIDPKRARYDGSYRVTAAFLAYVSSRYNKDLVRRLNQRLREGEYREEIWKELTRKTLKELGEEWRASLRAKPKSGR